MSLKHLLNHDDDVGAYVSHRPLEGWDDNGITIEYDAHCWQPDQPS